MLCWLASVYVCRLSASVTLHGWPAGGFTRAGQAMTSCRLQSNYSSTVTVHGGPVVLRPVRATPCYIMYTHVGEEAVACTHSIDTIRYDTIKYYVVLCLTGLNAAHFILCYWSNCLHLIQHLWRPGLLLNLNVERRQTVEMNKPKTWKSNPLLNWNSFLFLPTALTGKLEQSVASICLSVCLSVRLFPLCPLNRLIFELESLCVSGSWL